MEKSEYYNIFKNESSHFFYIGTHYTVIKLLESYLPKKRTNLILDAGCGTGLLITKLTKFGKVYGIDISDLAINFSRKRGLKNISKASVTKLPFAKDFFDVVISIDVLYHQRVHSDQKALKEFYRVLKPNGLLIIKVPAFNFLKRKHDQVVHTRHRYTKSEMKLKLQKAGFRDLKISYYNSILFPFILIKTLLEKLINSSTTSEINDLPIWLNKITVSILRWETKILISVGLPVGISLFAVSRKQI